MASSDNHSVCTGVDLVGRNLGPVSSYADFSGSNLTGATIASGWNLITGYPNYSWIARNNFNGATLIAVEFSQGSAAGSTFVNANLTKASFVNSVDASNADFSGANLTNAEFKRANLTGATFSGATLTGVTWVDSGSSDGSICPDGTTARSHDDTCVGHLTPAP